MSVWPESTAPICPACNTEKLKERSARCCKKCHDRPGWHVPRASPLVQETRPFINNERATTLNTLADDLLNALRKTPQPLDVLASSLKCTPGQALDALIVLRERGVNLHSLDGKWSLEKTPAPNVLAFEYMSRPDNTFVFGASSDQHYGSKYCRTDVADQLYDEFTLASVDRVFNAGNWIDGEDEKNKFDLLVHGLEPQVRYLVEHYPQRAGITTYAVWGEDHEGWFARREAIDVGKLTETEMRMAGRSDWVNLGFMEGRVDLVNANTGSRAMMIVSHPGGGSAYATSYRPQKIIEGLEGGCKPAVLLLGHYHKLSADTIRNVWCLQIGCAQDQTPFLRKKGIEPHIGGMIVTLRQDPKTGAIVRCLPDTMRFFNKAYYSNQWSRSGPVVQPEKIGIGT